MLSNDMENEAEIWLAIDGYEGMYEVSSMGRIRSLPRVIANGRSYRGRIMKTPVSTTGYMRFNLCRGGVREHRKVHMIVCRAFHGPRAAGQGACHKNGNPLDNRAENLRWGDQKSNSADAIAHGRIPRGAARHSSKLSEKDVLAIRASSETYSAMAEKYGVTVSGISAIRNRYTWKHVE